MADNETSNETGINRRALLGGAAVAGIGVIGGGVAGAAVAQGGDGVARRNKLTIDVACDGRTIREQGFPLEQRPDPDDRRGSPFSVEGWIYEEGTVSDGFIVTEDRSIGRWFCAGFFVGSAERDVPHINAQANFVFGSISGQEPFPTDTIITYGLGGTNNDARSHLAVLGGTGDYLAVTGEAIRWNIGKNNTGFFPLFTTPSPNFRYEFDLIHVV